MDSSGISWLPGNEAESNTLTLQTQNQVSVVRFSYTSSVIASETNIFKSTQKCFQWREITTVRIWNDVIFLFYSWYCYKAWICLNWPGYGALNDDGWTFPQFQCQLILWCLRLLKNLNWASRDFSITRHWL